MRRFNLSEWALTNRSLVLFAMILRARHHARYPFETSIRGAIR